MVDCRWLGKDTIQAEGAGLSIASSKKSERRGKHMRLIKPPYKDRLVSPRLDQAFRGQNKRSLPIEESVELELLSRFDENKDPGKGVGTNFEAQWMSCLL